MDERRYRTAEQAVWRYWDVVPTEHWVAVERARIRIQETGDPTGPPVLFVHGGGVAGTTWVDLASRLPEFRCLLVDRPGCGLSEPLPRGLDITTLREHAARLLVEVMDGLDLEQTHVVATSMGGYFALRTALVHPARVDRMVLLSWVMGAPPTAFPLIMRLASTRTLGSIMARLPVSERMVRSTLRQIGLGNALDAGRIPDVGIAWNAALHNHTDTRRHEFGIAGDTPLHRQVEELALTRDELARITTPTRIVFGTADPMGTVGAMEGLAAGMPHADLEIWQDAGHAVWLDRLEPAADVVREHLREPLAH